MNKFIRSLFIFYFLLFQLLFVVPSSLRAQTPPTPVPIGPLSCALDPKLGSCPAGVDAVIGQSQFYKGEKCVTTYAEFITNPLVNHYWALDEEITSQGKANERARQFLYWAISKGAIDQHKSIRQIWTFTQNVTLFLFLFIVALFGIGYIVGQRTNFQLKVQLWPTIMKIITGLLYIVFSYAITMSIIQISEILMKFFIESLGGDNLFNIYFSAPTSKEDSYATFIGCRDLNYKVQEAVRAEVMMFKLTNITYYVMGIMLILRKILLWFLIFVSPFLALLMPFILIRNTGWIWIGVFFQWVFYGPLFALFLGALNILWSGGIPFIFDFSRINSAAGYIYPTGINIVYGGPAQRNAQIINFFNNGNYVDTFAEYVVSLIMLWAVTFFPWWLLRIFRDYCCDGIMAMKNVLMSMYDKMGGPSLKPPSGSTAPTPSFTGTALKIQKETELTKRIHLETIEEVRKTRTEDITKSLNLSMNKLTDIARFETNKQTNETVRKNLTFLAQPTKAETPTERQKFMNIRTELFSRTIKDDKIARQIVSSISASRFEQHTRKEELLKSIPQVVSQPQLQGQKTTSVSYSNRITNIANNTVSSVHSHAVNSVANNTSMLQTIAQTTQAPVQQVQSVLSSYKTNIVNAPSQVVASVVKETGIAKEKVTSIIKSLTTSVANNKEMVKQIAQKTNLQEHVVKNTLKEELQTEAPQSVPEKSVEQTITIPPSVSIEDYEEVKKMWTQQYEKGEVPTSENITSRDQWVDQDIVFITNTLNKLLSTDEKLRQEGIDDLAYILPIFLINNLKGEELIVYLKAKVEAAKAVKHDVDKEKEITERLKKKMKEEDEENLVEVEKPKEAAAEKHLQMEQELPEEPEKKNASMPGSEQDPLKTKSISQENHPA